MSSAFHEDDEEQYVPEAPTADTELTVSATTLMVLFFGLVVLCGSFFGLGYSLGRREPSSNPLAAQPVAAAASTSHSKPAATNPVPLPAPTPVPTPPAETAPATSQPQPSTQAAAPVSAPQPATPSPALPTPAPAAAARPAPAPTVVAALPPPAPIMVQIAAVTEQETANLLLTALKKRGYPVAIRHELGDNLLHIQVGPFATRADAQAMRQKLQNDGYAAIVR